jgi:hypothetical protein
MLTGRPVVLRYLRTFLPWIAFAVLSTKDESRYGVVAGLVLSILFVAADRRAGRPWDAMVIELSSAVFFAGFTLAAFTLSPAPLGMYGSAVSAGWLAVTAWASLAARRPFTLGIARGMTPPEVQASPVFYRVNAVITAVWAAAFTLTALALGLVYDLAPQATAGIVAINVCGFALPVAFTMRYPQIVRSRYASRSEALS